MMRLAKMMFTCGALLTIAAVELQAGPITLPQFGDVTVFAQDSTTIVDSVSLTFDTQTMLTADTG